MKAFLLLVTFVTLLLPRTVEAEEIVSIRLSKSFGECVGYCKGDLIATKKAVTYTHSDWRGKLPKKTSERPMASGDWVKLCGSASWKAFVALPETIGCPDCADQGAEEVEITTASKTKKVSIEYGKDVPEISALLKTLRHLRREMEG